MKIGILTQPLKNNYGGLLQAYALQTILKRMGHTPIILQREPNAIHTGAVWSILRAIRNFITNRKVVADEIKKENEKHTRHFSQTYITPVSPLFHSTEELQAYAANGFGAFVVGSDQAWRPKFSYCITNYFLDFAEGWNVKRISYAVSFGVDSWEFSEEDGRICRQLARSFDAVSVREVSAVKLCKEHLGIAATWVLDPTLLLKASDYIALAESEKEQPQPNGLFCYILDEAPFKKECIEKCGKIFGLSPFFCMPRKLRKNEEYSIEDRSLDFPPPTKWIRSFMDARMVVTDSFHGCVFSIIFHKPFWVIENKERGNARIYSLLHLFHLEERLITKDTDFTHTINWNDVEEKRSQMERISLDFLNILNE